jgi:hypothetical protein
LLLDTCRKALRFSDLSVALVATAPIRFVEMTLFTACYKF